MKKIILFCFATALFLHLKAQEIDETAARQLVNKNLAAVGITSKELDDLLVSNAYKNKLPGTDMVYLQQSYKGIPVLNHLLVLAFKNGNLVSQTGTLFKGMSAVGGESAATPAVSAETAVRTALAHKKLSSLQALHSKAASTRKIDFGPLAVTKDNVVAELLWALVDNKMKLVWQVIVSPKQSPDYFLIRIDAKENVFAGEDNLTLYCEWSKKHADVAGHKHSATEVSNPSVIASTSIESLTDNNTSEQESPAPLSPLIVNNASYRVIPFPAESPAMPGGAPALVNNPWNAAPGNATSLKWHSDGTTDYAYTRGNNTWAYHDRNNQNTPDISRSATSTTAPDPLTFNFSPDFTKPPFQTTPVPNQQFNVTNLFYWNNVIHDVVYQYGFDEVGGNFQMNNQGRGGVGNDYVRAEAQDGSGSDNANFSTPADGSAPRMQMYLWSGVTKMVINTPAGIAGNYVVEEGVFSTANLLLNIGILTGQIVYYDDDAGAVLHEACGPPVNSITGKIALINRGNCGFAVKVKNAQLAGAIGVIMVNNVPGPPILMGGTDNTITIPAVMVSQADGALIAAQLANNVTVTLSNIAYDGDVDNGIVIHEFAHGISNRLTGGPAQASCLTNVEQMGEGWSDYYMLMLTQNWAGSNVNTGFTTARSVGTYAGGEPPTGLGIRNRRYSTNFNVNDLTYNTTIPGTGGQHARGEIWCATLWDMTWNIIQQTNSITPSIYTASGGGGNVIALKLVTEGMKLQPCNPGFIDGRDAILKADQLLYNGLYSCTIREAFRRRGMGALASQGSATSATDQTPDFTPYLSVTLSQNVTQIPEGQNIIYTNRVTSCGSLSNYLLTDTLPTNVTYVSGGTYNAVSRVVSFPLNFTTAGSQNYSFTVRVNNGSYYTPTTYLSEQVASSSLPATVTANSTTSTLWTVSTAQSRSTPNSLFTADVEGVSEQFLTTTNPIALGSNQSSFSFWHSYSTESGWDGGIIQISTDNGGSWTDLENNIVAGYYSGTIDATNGIPISGKKAYTGATTGFINSSVNLSAYAGQSIKLRWAFYSDAFDGGIGWFVDDILVKNEAVVNMRTSLINNSGTRVDHRDTVTLITQNLACVDAAISTQPANITVCGGSAASFTVAATGSTLNYQWQVSTDGGATYTNIASATTATLNLPAVSAAMNNNRYRVIVSNACPSTVTSTGAILTVTTPTAITMQPASVAACTGGNATFSVTATGSTLSYQWQLSTNGGTTWTAITGAITPTLVVANVSAAMNNNQYRVLLPSCIAGGLTSSAATLTVGTAISISTQPASTTACAGSAAAFSVTATGTAINYQWQVSTDGGTTYNNIPSATAATLNIPAVTAAMNNNSYRVQLSNGCATGSTSTAALLTVTTATVISQQPGNAAVCAGANTSFTVTATGSTLTYQWQVSTDNGVSWTNITGGTAATISLNAVTVAMNNNRYRVVLPGCQPGGVTSTAATLTVSAGATITTQPASEVACAGNNVSFTAAVTGAGLTYQWQVSTDAGVTWTDIAGASSNSLSLTAVTAAMNDNRYRLVVNSTCVAGPLTTNTATLTINNNITLTQQPVAVTLCAGLPASFTVAANGSGLTFQWQVSTNGGVSYTNVAGATAATLTLSSVTSAMNNNQYRAVLNGSCVSNLFSNSALLTVNGSVNIITQPANQFACAPVPASFSVSASGTSLTYQWELSTNSGSTWTAIAGATSTNLSIPSLSPTLSVNQYRVLVSGAPCGTLTSRAATLTVGQLPTVTISTTTSAVTPTQTATLTATSNQTGTYTYQWFKNDVLVPGASSNTLVVNVDNVGTYKVIANGSNGCNNVSNELILIGTGSTRLFVYPNPNYGLFQVRFYTDPARNLVRTINIYEPRGAKIFTKVYTVLTPYDKMEVDLGGSPAGVYYVELLDASGKKVASAGVTKF